MGKENEGSHFVHLFHFCFFPATATASAAFAWLNVHLVRLRVVVRLCTGAIHPVAANDVLFISFARILQTVILLKAHPIDCAKAASTRQHRRRHPSRCRGYTHAHTAQASNTMSAIPFNLNFLFLPSIDNSDEMDK